MKKGEIYKGSKRGRDAAYHPIVYLEASIGGSFIGGVLTHSGQRGNIRMEKEYFEENDNTGRKYDFNFDNTHLVLGRFIKPEDWGPYAKIGQLSKKGISFVEKQTNKLNPLYWDDYVNQF